MKLNGYEISSEIPSKCGECNFFNECRCDLFKKYKRFHDSIANRCRKLFREVSEGNKDVTLTAVYDGSKWVYTKSKQKIKRPYAIVDNTLWYATERKRVDKLVEYLSSRGYRLIDVARGQEHDCVKSVKNGVNAITEEMIEEDMKGWTE